MEYDGQPEMASFFDDLCFFWVLFLRILLGLGNSTDVMFGICRLVIE